MNPVIENESNSSVRSSSPKENFIGKEKQHAKGKRPTSHSEQEMWLDIVSRSLEANLNDDSRGSRVGESEGSESSDSGEIGD